MIAACDDDRAIVEALLGARADVNTKAESWEGCAFPARSARVGGGRWSPMQPCPPRPAGAQRFTLRRSAAASAPPWSCSSAAPISASRPTMGKLCRPQPRDGRTPIGAGERLANAH
jgi:hypothetical protein